MKNKTKKNLTPTSLTQTEAKASVIKLGIDIHQKHYVVVRQIDEASPQSPQKFTPEKFMAWVRKQLTLAQRVYSCYEAGCFGYVLHRQLYRLGVENVVVRPRNWDEYGQKVKTDGRDARELCSHLDRYLAGNKHSLCVVPAPQTALTLLLFGRYAPGTILCGGNSFKLVEGKGI
jgi:hypothetical protein